MPFGRLAFSQAFSRASWPAAKPVLPGSFEYRYRDSKYGLTPAVTGDSPRMVGIRAAPRLQDSTVSTIYMRYGKDT
jgi:hypothetical protein